MYKLRGGGPAPATGIAAAGGSWGMYMLRDGEPPSYMGAQLANTSNSGMRGSFAPGTSQQERC